MLLLLACLLLQMRKADAANITSLTGTWSSKSGAVFTGSDFYNPKADHLIEPLRTGSSYSFTDDGFFEEAIYITISNPTKPNCPKALLQYQHGSYTLHPNGSIVLHPIKADGRQLLSAPCHFKKAIYAKFNATKVFKQWEVIEDSYRVTFGKANPYRLNLWKWDGAPANPLYRVDSIPRMNNVTNIGGGDERKEDGLKKHIRRGAEVEGKKGLVKKKLLKMVEMKLGRIAWLGLGMISVGVTAGLLWLEG